MFSIRSGVFETNSSSSHSICIRNRSTENTIEVDVDNICDNLLNGRGAWKIKEEDVCFGRSPFRYLSKFSEKVLYAIACRIDTDDIENIVRKYVPEFSSFMFVDEDDYGYGRGYTDDCILPGWLNSNNVSLEDFLTDSRYFVICDGDEYCIYHDMMKLGFIDSSVKEHNAILGDLEYTEVDTDGD